MLGFAFDIPDQLRCGYADFFKTDILGQRFEEPRHINTFPLQHL